MLNCLYGRIGIKDIVETETDKIDDLTKTHNYSFIKEIDNKHSLIKYDLNKDNEKLSSIKNAGPLNFNKNKNCR